MPRRGLYPIYIMDAKSRAIAVIFIVLLTGFVIYIHSQQLTEALGSGPPYYSRTINMDKWSNPVPYLLILDLISLGIVCLVWKRRKQAND